MGLSPNERITQEIAREVCQRTESKALLAGSIAALGSHYAIGLKALNCQEWGLTRHCGGRSRQARNRPASPR